MQYIEIFGGSQSAHDYISIYVDCNDGGNSYLLYIVGSFYISGTLNTLYLVGLS